MTNQTPVCIERIFTSLKINSESISTSIIDSDIVSSIIVPTKKAKEKILKNLTDLKVITVYGSVVDNETDLIEVTGKLQFDYIINNKQIIFIDCQVPDNETKLKLIELLNWFNRYDQIDNEYFFLKATRQLKDSQYIVSIIYKSSEKINLFTILRTSV